MPSGNLENISKAVRYSKAVIKVKDYKNALVEAEEMVLCPSYPILAQISASFCSSLV
jgi:hypothetical protein